MRKIVAFVAILFLSGNCVLAQLSFKPSISLDKNYNPGPLVSGDFDGNSFPDLAALDQNNKRVILFYNPGQVAEPKMQIYEIKSPGPGSLSNLVAADFNKDGKTDLAFADYANIQPNVGQQSLVFLTSTGTSFSQQSQVPSVLNGYFNYLIKALDYDLDGNVDLIISDSFTFLFYKGDGQGGFTASALSGLPKIYNNDYFLYDVSDLNADGQYDLVFTTADTIFVNLQNSNHSFTTSKYLTPSINHLAFSLGTGDLTGDGVKEILITYQINNSSTYVPNFIAEYVNDGNGSFATPPITIFSGGLWVPPIVTGDYDGDGRIDILTGSVNGASEFYLLKNTGNNQFTDVSFKSDYDVVDVNCVFVDLNNDGTLEIASLSYFKFISIYTQSGGVFHFDERLVFGAPAYRGQAVDMNKDGYLDIISVSQLSGSIALYINNGGVSFQAPIFLTEDAGLGAVQAADFNGDGFFDVAYSSINSVVDPFVKVILSDAQGNLTIKKTIAPSGSDVLAAADYNKDGFIDLAAVNAIYFNDGKGNFSPYFFSVSFSPFNAVAADINGDSVPDLIFNDASSTYISYNDGTGHFNTFSAVPSSGYTYGLDVVDMNNDNRLDLLSIHTGASGADSFSVFFNQGNGTFKQVITQGISSETVFWNAAGGDFDGDGRKDIAVVSGGTTSSGASIYLQQPDGSFVFTIDAPIKSATGYAVVDYLRVADMNNDGRNDIVSFANNGDPVAVAFNDLLVAPTQPAKVKLTTLSDTRATFALTGGNGKGKIAVIRKAGSPTGKPKNNIFYSSNSQYGIGAQIGSDNYVVLFKDTTAFNVTALTKATSYTIDVYSYNVNSANTLTNVLMSQLDSVTFKTKDTQSITVAPVTEQIVGTSPVILSAIASSGLPVKFSVTSGGITIKGDTITLVSAGPVKLRASVSGDTTYLAASTEIDFCVDPPIPTIMVVRNGTAISLISSSANNNTWLFNNVPIDSAKNSTLIAVDNGVYKVQVNVGGCKSTSSPTGFIVAGIDENSNGNFSYPSPFNDVLYVPIDGHTTQIDLVDSTGKIVMERFVEDQAEEQLNTGSLSPGVYFLRIKNNLGVQVQKTMKISK